MRKNLIALLAMTAALARGADPNATKIDFSKSTVPALQLTLEVPAGWSVEWYRPEDLPSVARIHRNEGREAIVITATNLGEKNRGKDENEIFSVEFLRESGRNLGAPIRRREKTDSWNGAYFEYVMQGPPGTRVDVRNWMMLANGHLVQFQCYFLHDLSVAIDTRKQIHDALAKDYALILGSLAKPARQP